MPNSKGLNFRHIITPHDAPVVRNMVRATGFFSDAEVAIAVELVDERLSKGAFSGYEFVFAEREGSVIGYACFGEIPCTLGSYDLYWIIVDPGVQREGVGQQLMHKVEFGVKQLGGRGIYIDTSGSLRYESTHRFYERCGYRCIAKLPDFYAVNDAKLIYWRSIN